MADFTIVDSECQDHGNTLSRASSFSVTPALGDIVFVGGDASVGTNPALSGGGVTWTLMTNGLHALTSEFAAVFECTAAASPTAEALTLTSDDNFADMCIAVVRPVDLDSAAVVGSNGAETSDTVTVTLTTSSPAALLVYAHRNSTGTFAADTTNGFAELLNQTNASGDAHYLQEKFGDSASVVIDADGISVTQIGIALQFSATGGGSSQTAPGQAMPRAFRRAFGRGVRRSMEKINNLWLPTGPLIAGAR